MSDLSTTVRGCTKHRYYSLTRWNQWQSLSSQKITLSKYPAPPEQADVAQCSEEGAQEGEHAAESSQHFPIFPREIPGNSGEYREIPPQYNVSESNVIQEKRIEEEDEGQPPPNIVTFPAARDDADNTSSYPSEQILEATKQVAAILKLSSSDALTRVIADYIDDPSISLLGEADTAREWIEDPERNCKHQRLTPAFFRRWLKREQASSQRSHTHSLSPPGSRTSLPGAADQHVANGAGPPGSTNATENPYHLYVEQRARALLLSTKGDGYAQTS
jgi:hypothetical protein